MGRLFALAVMGICSIALSAELPSSGELAEKIGAPPARPAPRAQSLRPLMEVKIDELAKKVGEMPPAEAASAWLELFDTWVATRRQRRDARVDFNDLLAALPPPAAWEELGKAIAARPVPQDNNTIVARHQALRLLGSVLARNAAASQAESDALVKLLRAGNADDPQARELSAVAIGQTPGDVVSAFEKQIETWPAMQQGRIPLQAPDLVTLAGEAKAAALLRKAMALKGAELHVGQGTQTERLARKIALEEIDKMQTAQWQLASNLDSTKLFEALRKKFRPFAGPNLAPPGANQPLDDDEYRTASAYYLLGLIIAGRTDDAIAQSKEMPANEVNWSYGALPELENAGHVATVQAFLHRLLSENPDLPLWDTYVSLSAKAGKTTEMLEVARKSAAREGLEPGRRLQIRQQLGKALLAADQPGEGVAVLRECIEGDEGFETALLLGRIGKVLQRPALIDESFAAARKLIDEKITNNGAPRDYEVGENVTHLAALMEQVGRRTEAVDLIAAALAANKRQAGQNEPDMSLTQDLAVALVGIYHRAGRHADVLKILESMPLWSATDLAHVYTEYDSTETPLGYMAAAALADAGRQDEAKNVLNAVLDANGGFDPTYELLIKVDGERAIARLDELFARDQFEERPLIWKGTMLVKQGKIDDAEKIIKQAISIDPSDGEQGKGTRMRVYGVFADILEKKGDAETAKVFRGAVKAIRTAEDADDWWEAGLLTRAIKQYEQALTYFQDAYCIQSRLALRMAEMGFTEKAEEHYRKAYELMPDSFGRVESHCFGCEGAFRGPSARKIAEEVFNRLLQKNPDKPQIHYLLGYLREQQGRYGEAIDPMKSAVKLDPDYLNAWKHIQTLAAHMYLPAELRDAAALNLLRLDPYSRHGSANLSDVRDLKKLWDVAAGAAASRVEKPQVLLSLGRADDARGDTDSYVYSSGREGIKSPGEAIGRTRTVKAIVQVINRQ